MLSDANQKRVTFCHAFFIGTAFVSYTAKPARKGGPKKKCLTIKV